MQRAKQNEKNSVPRSAVLRSVRGRQLDDSGNAMVLAIASVLLVALLMGTIFSSVMFSVGNTTATRAHAASSAAAEGGAQQVARKLLQNSVDATTSCSGLTVPNDAWIKYKVDGVWFKEKESDTTWKRCDNGGLSIPKLAHAVRVKTTGYSDSAGTDPGPGGAGDKGSIGQQGNKRGDTSTVEMTFVRPGDSALQHAIFGESAAYVNQYLDLSPDTFDPAIPSEPVTAVTNGLWTCPQGGIIRGSVYAMGGVSIPGNCVIQGDLYVKGNINVSSSLIVGKRLFVDGNVSGQGFKLQVDDTALVSGDLTYSGTGIAFTKDLWIEGHFKVNSPYGQTFGSDVIVGKPVSTQGEIGVLRQKLVDEGRLRELNQWPSGVPGDAWIFPPEFDSDSAEAKDKLGFPFLATGDAMFNGFGHIDPASSLGYTRSGTTCTQSVAKKVVIEHDSIIDLSDCDWKIGQKLDFELKADAVVFAKSIYKDAAMTVTTASSVGDDTRHTLFLVAVPKPDQDSCGPSDQGGNMVFNSGDWSQVDPARNGAGARTRTKVVLYSAGETKWLLGHGSNKVLNGQLYGCNVNTPDGMTMTFAKGGKDLTNTLWDLGLGSVRDITS